MQDIDTLFDSMAEYWNRHDMRAYAALWVEDCDFVNVVGFHRHSRAELLAELEYLHAGRFKHTQVQMNRRQIRHLSPDLAVANVWWTITGDPGQPGVPTNDGTRNGIFIHVMQRTPEGWRLVASQNTDTLPIPDPMRDPLRKEEGLLAGARA